MKLAISQLKDGENRFQYRSQETDWVKALVTTLTKEGFTLESPLTLDIAIHKHEPDYYLKGVLDFKVRQSCSRCAEGFTLPVHHPFELALAHVSELKRETKEDLTSESDELDLSYFEGSEMNLEPLVHEQFVLSLPYQSLCQEDCLGICQHCGQNRNLKACDCHEKNRISPFAVLENLKAKQAK